MALDPRVRQVLEQRGVANVRLLLQNPDAAGVGPHSIVKLGTHGLDPARSDVEDWLREKDLEADGLATRRHAEQMAIGKEGVRWAKEGAHWAKWAFWAAVASAIIAIVALVAH